MPDRIESAGSLCLPVELHLHLEGTLEPEFVHSLSAGRPAAAGVDFAALYAFSDFLGFLEAYRRVVTLLTRPADFGAMTRAACARLAGIGVRYAELIYTPLIHTRRGLEHVEVSRAIVAALDEAREESGLECNLIYDTVRQWGAEAALETAALAVADRSAGLPVVGFGVGGDELSVPANELVEAFSLAKQAGLYSYVHAGEVGPPESVWEALEVLGADRIGHGVSAARDPLLMDELARRGTALDLCPTSNLLTRAVPRLEEHPLPLFLEHGLTVTLGSDDPGFFGSWLDNELALCRQLWGWDSAVVSTLARNASRSAFLPLDVREALAARLGLEQG
ncbi:adenosine deaminase [bacterium]|nr:adenosine deaminase [bacterium]